MFYLNIGNRSIVENNQGDNEIKKNFNSVQPFFVFMYQIANESKLLRLKKMRKIGCQKIFMRFK